MFGFVEEYARAFTDVFGYARMLGVSKGTHACSQLSRDTHTCLHVLRGMRA